MKLHSHPDFDQAIIQATEHFKKIGIREALIEKDYYVTEVLRTIANDLGSNAIFNEMSFAHSDAIFPTSGLYDILRAEYSRQCQSLCYRDFPSWEEVQDRFRSLRSVL